MLKVSTAPRSFLLAGAAIAGAGIIALAAMAASSSRPGQQPPATPEPLVFELRSTRVLTIETKAFSVDGGLDRDRLTRALRRRLPRVETLRRGRARITVRVARRRAIRDALALGLQGGTVALGDRTLSSTVRAPVIRQRLRNNCESAALQVLLAATGVRVDQLRLQREFPKDGPIDPQGVGSERIWGDPDVGYVGRPEGGGVAGGFGIYPGPVAKLARKHGRALDDLSGARAAAVYARLRQGRAVMAWIGLSEGPYGEWRSPRGRRVRVNFGEHTVVLHGVRADGLIRVVNPLQGTRELWTTEQFETMWARLGNRALAT